jgi:dihydropteroate synthase
MQDNPRYDDVLVEVYLWIEERIAAAEAAGIARDNILIDPGFGFGKNVAHNLELMNGLALLHSLGCPIVLGASRKRTIGALSNGRRPTKGSAEASLSRSRPPSRACSCSGSTTSRKQSRRSGFGAGSVTRR